MIREANRTDSVNLAALATQVWLHTYATEGIRTEISKYVLSTFTEEYFDDLIDDQDRHVLVFIQESHLRGFIAVNLESTFEQQSNGYEVTSLYVQEHFHGKGIGRSLLHEIELRFGDTFWLTTWVYNETAIGFYRHLGFKDIGRVDFDLDGEKHENRVLAFSRT